MDTPYLIIRLDAGKMFPASKDVYISFDTEGSRSRTTIYKSAADGTVDWQFESLSIPLKGYDPNAKLLVGFHDANITHPTGAYGYAVQPLGGMNDRPQSVVLTSKPDGVCLSLSMYVAPQAASRTVYLRVLHLNPIPPAMPQPPYVKVQIEDAHCTIKPLMVVEDAASGGAGTGPTRHAVYLFDFECKVRNFNTAKLLVTLLAPPRKGVPGTGPALGVGDVVLAATRGVGADARPMLRSGVPFLLALPFGAARLHCVVCLDDYIFPHAASSVPQGAPSHDDSAQVYDIREGATYPQVGRCLARPMGRGDRPTAPQPRSKTNPLPYIPEFAPPQGQPSNVGPPAFTTVPDQAMWPSSPTYGPGGLPAQPMPGSPAGYEMLPASRTFNATDGGQAVPYGLVGPSSPHGAAALPGIASIESFQVPQPGHGSPLVSAGVLVPGGAAVGSPTVGDAAVSGPGGQQFVLVPAAAAAAAGIPVSAVGPNGTVAVPIAVAGGLASGPSAGETPGIHTTMSRHLPTYQGPESFVAEDELADGRALGRLVDDMTVGNRGCGADMHPPHGSPDIHVRSDMSRYLCVPLPPDGGSTPARGGGGLDSLSYSDRLLLEAADAGRAGHGGAHLSPTLRRAAAQLDALGRAGGLPALADADHGAAAARSPPRYGDASGVRLSSDPPLFDGFASRSPLSPSRDHARDAAAYLSDVSDRMGHAAATVAAAQHAVSEKDRELLERERAIASRERELSALQRGLIAGAGGGAGGPAGSPMSPLTNHDRSLRTCAHPAAAFMSSSLGGTFDRSAGGALEWTCGDCRGVYVTRDIALCAVCCSRAFLAVNPGGYGLQGAGATAAAAEGGYRLLRTPDGARGALSAGVTALCEGCVAQRARREAVVGGADRLRRAPALSPYGGAYAADRSGRPFDSPVTPRSPYGMDGSFNGTGRSYSDTVGPALAAARRAARNARGVDSDGEPYTTTPYVLDDVTRSVYGNMPSQHNGPMAAPLAAMSMAAASHFAQAEAAMAAAAAVLQE